MSFFGDLFTGSNNNLDNDINQSGQVAGFGTSVGEGDINAASGFYNDLLSGNQAKEAQVLAPEISGVQQRGQQQIQTAGEFGNRSGGTNASAQNNIDSQRSEVNDMIAKLTGGAASGLAGIGTSTLGLGLQAIVLMMLMLEHHCYCPWLQGGRCNTIQALLAPKCGCGSFCVTEHDFKTMIEPIAE